MLELQNEHSDANLDWILAPLSCADFLDQYWGRAPYRVARVDALYYERLLPMAELDYALQHGCRMPGAVELLNDGQQPVPCRRQTVARQALRRGASVRINSMQRYVRTLEVLCRRVEEDFSFPVNVNLYLSPGGSKALPAHFDRHDVFVLQIYGRKNWKIFARPAINPLEFVPNLHCERYKQPHEVRSRYPEASNEPSFTELEDFTLHAGDALYLPRGYWHAAESGPNSFSCHLTIGVQVFTYLDLLTVALRTLTAQKPLLREALPPGFATAPQSRSRAVEQVVQIMKDVFSGFNGDIAISDMIDIFVGGRASRQESLLDIVRSPSGALDLNIDTIVARPFGVVCGVFVDAEKATLRSSLRELSLPLEFEAALRYIASTDRFVVKDLPGNITDGERTSVVESSIHAGFLVSVAGQ